MSLAEIDLSNQKPPTYEEILRELLAPATGPVPLDDLIEQVQARRPSQAKNPRSGIRNQIKQQEGRLLILVEGGKAALPLRLAYQGVRFRIPLDRDAVDQGLLLLEPTLQSYLPWDFSLGQVQLVDAAGKPIPYGIKTISRRERSVFSDEGYVDVKQDYHDLRSWLRSQRIFHKEHLLFTIVDWENGVFRVDREPSVQRDEALIESRDRLLADIFYALLEEARHKAIYRHICVPQAYAQLPDKGGCPPYPWRAVVEADERLDSEGWRIEYSDSEPSPFKRMLIEMEGRPKKQAVEKISKEQGQQVYRFKAKLTRNARLWREIELQGQHTLAEFDRELREAFEHDLFDHLGGFWRLVRRGGEKSTRYREVDLGSVDPFGGGDGADVQIGSLGLQAGDRLKYVYDFGDWIAHTLTLEETGAAQPGVVYPRETRRNAPHYMNCVPCQKKGREARAEWICLTCSNHQQEEIVLCQECFEQHDEEHYQEKILY